MLRLAQLLLPMPNGRAVRLRRQLLMHPEEKLLPPRRAPRQCVDLRYHRALPLAQHPMPDAPPFLKQRPQVDPPPPPIHPLPDQKQTPPRIARSACTFPRCYPSAPATASPLLDHPARTVPPPHVPTPANPASAAQASESHAARDIRQAPRCTPPQ